MYIYVVCIFIPFEDTSFVAISISTSLSLLATGEDGKSENHFFFFFSLLCWVTKEAENFSLPLNARHIILFFESLIEVRAAN